MLKKLKTKWIKYHTRDMNERDKLQYLSFMKKYDKIIKRYVQPLAIAMATFFVFFRLRKLLGTEEVYFIMAVSVIIMFRILLQKFDEFLS